MYLINGQPREMLDVRDRGIQFGDGCFTTARIVDGNIRFIDIHLARLRRDARRLKLNVSFWRALREEMVVLAQEVSRGVLKVIVTRGPGGRGYSTVGCRDAVRILSLAPWPAHYESLKQTGVRLVSSPVPLGRNPWLAGVKHLNRLEQVLIRMQLEQSTGDEALVLDSAGMLVECCAANLFWRQGERIFTPDVSQCGVEGTMRRYILRILREAGRPVLVVNEPPSALVTACEIVVCNALMPVLPVADVDGQPYTQRELFNFLSPRCE